MSADVVSLAQHRAELEAPDPRDMRTPAGWVPPAPAKANAKHSMLSPERYSPSPVVEAARALMGGIDLDPASCAMANRTVRAARYITREEDGLAQEWHGRVWLNPPGGKYRDKAGKSRGLVPAFWRRLLEEMRAGRVSEAVWLGYSLEQLATLQGDGGWPRGPLWHAAGVCVCRARLEFLEPREGELDPVPLTSPTHANFVAYLNPHSKRAGVAFLEHFERFGEVVLP